MNLLLRMYPGDACTFFVANVLVQVTFVILAAWLMARLGGRWNAAWRHSIYLAALACTLASPVLSWATRATGVTLATLQSSATTARPAASERASTARFPEFGLAETPPPRGDDLSAHRATENVKFRDLPEEPWSLSFADALRALGAAALVVWLLGIVSLLARWRHGLSLIAALRRAADPLDCEATAELLGQVRQALGTDRLPPMAVSAGLDRPIMVGLFSPLVMLPEGMLRTLRGPELVDVLVHECAHAVCRHHVVGFLQRIVAILFWPHPLVHLLNRELARSREEVCDNYVLRREHAPRYARALLELSQSLVGVSPIPTAIGLFHCRWRLEDRIADLIDRRRRVMIRVNRWSMGVLAAALLAVALPIASVHAVRAEPEPSAKSDKPADEPKGDLLSKSATFRGKTLRQWAVLSNNDDDAVEQEARLALRDALPEAMPALIELLKDEETEVASAAASALEEMGSEGKPAVPALIEMLKRQKVSRSPMAPSVCDLRQIIGSKTTIPAALVDLLKDENANVRRGAAFSVAYLAFGFPGDEKTKDDPGGYYKVVDASAVIPVLNNLLSDKDPGVRSAAVKALVLMSPDSRPVAVPVLIELLKDKDPNVRWMTVWDLGKIGPDAKAALPALTAMIHDPSFGVRENVAEALESISPVAAKAAVPALLDLLKDSCAGVRERTMRVLLRLDPKLKTVIVPVLMEMLKGDQGQRARAAGILGEIGPDALGESTVKQAVPAVKQLLLDIHEHGNWCYRMDTAVALMKLDPAEKPFAISALIELLNHPYCGARWTTAEALGKIGPDAKAAVPALTGLLKDRQKRVQRAAKEALKSIQGDKA
jgi:HEAT repeat protein/beta-lactamase regulating signal transducer with metallopeptidase domain